MATYSDRKMRFMQRVDEDLARIAYAESGELYPEHPHKVKSITDAFTEVAFAESGEELHLEPEPVKPPKVCVKGETRGGMCV